MKQITIITILIIFLAFSIAGGLIFIGPSKIPEPKAGYGSFSLIDSAEFKADNGEKFTVFSVKVEIGTGSYYYIVVTNGNSISITDL